MNTKPMKRGVLPQERYVSREGLIVDVPMLGFGDLNNYVGRPGTKETFYDGTWETTHRGAAFTTIGSPEGIKIPIPESLRDWPCTIFAVGQVQSLSGYDLYITIANDGAGDQMFGLRFNNGNAQGFVYTTGFNTTTQVGVTVAVGDIVTMAFVCASATDRRLYLNGEYLEIDTDSDTFPTHTGDLWLGIGASWKSGGAFYDPSKCLMARVYERVLTDSEIKILTNDPWADYRKTTLNESYFGAIIGSGAPAFNAAWALNSNIRLQ